ncbi:hypothetical protein [Maridesulfovibrio sp.]|uniref:hypothetical protein n=1 Tax=Maridesulfovibrio sp. TaxID=2795000 RepID=UPI002A187AA3|nr:hypothetical protein [Maridesulfovibrio sp.]
MLLPLKADANPGATIAEVNGMLNSVAGKQSKDQLRTFYLVLKKLNEESEQNYAILDKAIRIEVFLLIYEEQKGEGSAVPDIISLHNKLRKINALGGTEIPFTKYSDSKEFEKIIGRVLNEMPNQEILDRGMRVLYRTGDGYSSRYAIRQALPYFELAEANGFDDTELYRAFIDVYNTKACKDELKSIIYCRKFLNSANRKGLDRGSVLRTLALNLFTTTPPGQLARGKLDEIIAIMEDAKRHGDPEAASYISQFKSLMADQSSGGGGAQGDPIAQFASYIPLNNGLRTFTELGRCSALDARERKICQEATYAYDFDQFSLEGRAKNYVSVITMRDCSYLMKYEGNEMLACESILPYLDNREVMIKWVTLGALGYVVDVKRNRIFTHSGEGGYGF